MNTDVSVHSLRLADTCAYSSPQQCAYLHFLCILKKQELSFTYVVKVTQLCPTFCDPVDSSPPGSSVHGICQARILEWVAVPFSRGSSQPKDRTRVSCIASGFSTS